MLYKRHPHTPIHFFCDDSPYFITSAIYKKRPLLADEYIKTELLRTIQQIFNDKGWQLNDWVILNNHYHILGYSRKGEDLSKIMQNIHRQSGFLISQRTHCEKPVWWNYWDYCPRDEKQCLVRQNYLFNNPIKHGYVTNLMDYPFSSFLGYFGVKGREYLVKQFRDNPGYKDLKIEEDDF